MAFGDGEGESGFARQERAEEMLQEGYGAHTLDSLYGILADHTGVPQPLCRHGSETPGETVFSVLADVTNRTLRIGAGNPCTAEFQAFSF